MPILTAALLVIASLAGAGCSNEEEGTVYYSLFIPRSGYYSTGYDIVVTTTEAMLEYINTEDPIEGVTLKLLTYDSESTSEQAIPGYQWLEQQGAKFIAVTDTEVVPTLKSTVDTDKFPVFMCSGTKIATQEPGYVFPIPMIFYDQVQPLMKYIMDEWDYTANPSGPKIGLFGWNLEYGTDRRDAIEDYIENNPGKFADDEAVIRLVSTDTTNFVNEVEALKDCDYIFAGATATGMASFMGLMRSSGYNDPVFCFLGSDTGFMSIYAATEDGRNNIDGTLWASDAGYYKVDDNEIAALSRYLIDDYFPAGVVGITPGMTTLVASLLVPIDILRTAASLVDDPEDITGELINYVATTMTFDYEDFPMADYSDDNRALLTSVMIYQYSAADNDWSSVSEWITAPRYE